MLVNSYFASYVNSVSTEIELTLFIESTTIAAKFVHIIWFEQLDKNFKTSYIQIGMKIEAYSKHFLIIKRFLLSFILILLFGISS